MKRTMDRDPMNHKCFPMWWRAILPAKSKFIIQRLETQLLLLKTLYSFYFLIPDIFHLKIWDYWFDDVSIILIVSKIIFLSKLGQFLFFFTQINFFYTNFFCLFFLLWNRLMLKGNSFTKTRRWISKVRMFRNRYEKVLKWQIRVVCFF